MYATALITDGAAVVAVGEQLVERCGLRLRRVGGRPWTASSAAGARRGTGLCFRRPCRRRRHCSAAHRRRDRRPRSATTMPTIAAAMTGIPRPPRPPVAVVGGPPGAAAAAAAPGDGCWAPYGRHGLGAGRTAASAAWRGRPSAPGPLRKRLSNSAGGCRPRGGRAGPRTAVRRGRHRAAGLCWVATRAVRRPRPGRAARPVRRQHLGLPRRAPRGRRLGRGRIARPAGARGDAGGSPAGCGGGLRRRTRAAWRRLAGGRHRVAGGMAPGPAGGAGPRAGCSWRRLVGVMPDPGALRRTGREPRAATRPCPAGAAAAAAVGGADRRPAAGPARSPQRPGGSGCDRGGTAAGRLGLPLVWLALRRSWAAAGLALLAWPCCGRRPHAAGRCTACLLGVLAVAAAAPRGRPYAASAAWPDGPGCGGPPLPARSGWPHAWPPDRPVAPVLPGSQRLPAVWRAARCLRRAVRAHAGSCSSPCPLCVTRTPTDAGTSESSAHATGSYRSPVPRSTGTVTCVTVTAVNQIPGRSRDSAGPHAAVQRSSVHAAACRSSRAPNSRTTGSSRYGSRRCWKSSRYSAPRLERSVAEQLHRPSARVAGLLHLALLHLRRGQQHQADGPAARPRLRVARPAPPPRAAPPPRPGPGRGGSGPARRPDRPGRSARSSAGSSPESRRPAALQRVTRPARHHLAGAGVAHQRVPARLGRVEHRLRARR